MCVCIYTQMHSFFSLRVLADSYHLFAYPVFKIQQVNCAVYDTDAF